MHWLLAILLGSLFGLNRLKVYVAANISNPLMAPFLLMAELQLGAWVTGGPLYGRTNLSDIRLWGVAQDLLVGSLLLGGILGAVGATVTYAVMTRRSFPPQVGTLLAQASERYLSSGFGSWHFASVKIRCDPMYRELLKQGLLPPSGVLVDCGCGQGLLLALLATARERYADGTWPTGWPAPPSALALQGIETRPRMVRKARLALGRDATIIEGDLREMSIPPCDVAVLFDVVHLMPQPDQDRLVAGVRDALRPGGILVLREADAAGGWRFRTIRAGNWLNRAVQGQWRRRFYFRTAAEWCQDLTDIGFEVSVQPMGQGTPFANVLLCARRVEVTTPRVSMG